MYFAEYDGNIGTGNTLDAALDNLSDLSGYDLSGTTFYEGIEIKVQLVVKQVPVKVKVTK